MLLKAVCKSSDKTPAKLFLGKKNITPFYWSVMACGTENELMVRDVDKLIKEGANSD